MKIIDKKIIAPNVHEMTLAAPGIAEKARAGQFAIAIPNRFSERTPLTLADWDAGKGEVSVVFLEIGDATRDLAALTTGDEMYSFTGPLGQPFDIDKFGKVGLVGGCYGIGGILPAARAMQAAGNEVVAFSEARSSFLLYWNDKLEEAAHDVRYSTSDGSLGRKGHAHDLLAENLEEGEHFDRILAIGCTFMMYRIAQVTRPYQIKTVVSMNPIMIDGTGMCGACRLSIGGKTKFACVDGPHFDGHEVDWDVVLARRKAYLEEEIVAKER
ncbi:MAG: sulfide/dihydroorotate dehydrogenase-like FAD/NAD-binding protein [Desulfocapsaceae bacterium]|nr:sulfide/dihydroorotate dehydrogenase-like FAD/NAD-binding protein [Desulfocapsaceae bacterium]